MNCNSLGQIFVKGDFLQQANQISAKDLIDSEKISNFPSTILARLQMEQNSLLKVS